MLPQGRFASATLSLGCEDGGDTRACLVCKQAISGARSRSARIAVELEPVSESFRRPDPHFGIDVADFGGASALALEHWACWYLAVFVMSVSGGQRDEIRALR